MPFNQTFSFPHCLTLRTTDEGVRMFAESVAEIETLHQKQYVTENVDLAEGKSATLNVSGDIFDIRARFFVGSATAVGLDICGERITYDVRENRLNDVEMKPVDGQISLQVLVDRPMLEIIGNNGRVFITKPRDQKGDVSTVKAFADAGKAKLLSLQVNELKSIWKAYGCQSVPHA